MPVQAADGERVIDYRWLAAIVLAAVGLFVGVRGLMKRGTRGK